MKFKNNPWFLSVVTHLGVVLFIALLIWMRRPEPGMIVLSLEPISSKAVQAESAEDDSTDEAEMSKVIKKPSLSSKVNSQQSSVESAFGIATAKEQYFYELKKFFQRQLVYPAVSASLREKGRVEVVFSISRDGVISDVSIHKPCAHSRLNQAALSLVQSSTRFKSFPPQLSESQMRLAIPIDYEI